MYNKQKFVNLRSTFLFFLGVADDVAGDAHMLRERERETMFSTMPPI